MGPLFFPGSVRFVMMFFIPVLLQWFSIAKLEGLWPRHERVWWTLAISLTPLFNLQHHT